MNDALWAAALLAAAVLIAVLLARLYLLRKSADEICSSLAQKLAQDTNTLIDISSRDRHMRRLASEINVQLKVLRRERQRYQQGDREVKEAITNISHDLRTPLTAICGYLDLARQEEMGEPLRRYLSRIEERTEALRGLTEELFRYSIAASSQELRPERVDLVRALEEALLSFYGAMQERAIHPDLSLAQGPVWRELDAGALNRIFSNLIANALKYSDGDLCVSLGADGRIAFSNSAKKLTAVSAGRLFDRFYTVESGRDSTGLGLSIAKLLTERMGGSIEARYHEGRLSVVLRFPA